MTSASGVKLGMLHKGAFLWKPSVCPSPPVSVTYAFKD